MIVMAVCRSLLLPSVVSEAWRISSQLVIYLISARRPISSLFLLYCKPTNRAKQNKSKNLPWHFWCYSFSRVKSQLCRILLLIYLPASGFFSFLFKILKYPPPPPPPHPKSLLSPLIFPYPLDLFGYGWYLVSPPLCCLKSIPSHYKAVFYFIHG